MQRARTECRPTRTSPIRSARGDRCAAHRQRRGGPVALGAGRDAADEDVGPQAANVAAEALDLAVGGHEEVQDVEALGSFVALEARIGTGALADRGRGLRRVPAVTVDERCPIGSRCRGDRQQPVAAAAGQRLVLAANVHESIAGHAVRRELGLVERLGPQRLDGVAPEACDVHA